ncbi:ABC transporter substrate-binding protein [Bacillus sp. SD088]|uniref:ABC transporter substrate-binding protein n=1 Tax=Bacillus sp. SD088 TaxID=2782012 RepID=UPI001A959406|nr:extracellular solute-binding protein [Bacillus sp. SD088]MBO0991610.1 extracellular solute-binding protein [Bacillus sp. SD088]
MTKKWFRWMIVGLLFIFMTACSTNTHNESREKRMETDQQDNKEEKSDEPVTIKIAIGWDDQIFDSRFKEIEKKLGNIKIERIPFDTTWGNLEEIFASGVVPDIVVSIHYDTIKQLLDDDLIYPLDDLIAQSDFNLEDLNPALVSYARSYDPEGRLIGMPDGVGFKALFYNKDIFDLFGVEYPIGEITWDEAMELAKQMTGERNGQKYMGLVFDEPKIPIEQWAVNPIDPDTDEVLLTKEPAFKKYYELMDRYYSIPGIMDVEEEGDLFAQGFAAMNAGWHQTLLYDWGDLEGTKEHIDIAPLPTWPEKPGVHPYLTTTPMMIMKDSEHVEEAFAILSEYVSKENQLKISRAMASGTVLLDEEIYSQTGAEVPSYKDKNIAAFYELTPAELKSQSQWDRLVDYKLDDFAKSDDDVVTFLRKLQEEIEINIKDEKAKQE